MPVKAAPPPETRWISGSSIRTLWVLDSPRRRLVLFQIPDDLPADTPGQGGTRSTGVQQPGAGITNPIPAQPPDPSALPKGWRKPKSWPLPTDLLRELGAASPPLLGFEIAALDEHEVWMLDRPNRRAWLFRRGRWLGPWPLEAKIGAVAAVGPQTLWVHTPAHPERSFALLGAGGKVLRRFAPQDMAATPWLIARADDGGLLAVRACRPLLRRYDPNGRLLAEKALDGPLPPAPGEAEGQCSEAQRLGRLQAFGIGFSLRVGTRTTLERYDPEGYWLESLALPATLSQPMSTAFGLWDADSQTFSAGPKGLLRHPRAARPPRGRVLTPEGEAVQRAGILVKQGHEVRATTNTDARGSFEVAGLTHREEAQLDIFAGGYLQKRLPGELRESLARAIILQPAPQQCLWVYDGSRGAPIESFTLGVARVVKGGQGHSESNRMNFTVKDPEGHGCLSPPWPLPWSIRVTAAGYAQRDLLLTEPVELEVDLAPEALLALRVEDPEGKALALAGASVQALDSPSPPTVPVDEGALSDVKSDAEGMAIIEGLEAGSYRLRIRHTAFPGWSEVVQLAAGRNPITVRMAAGEALEAKVLDAHNAPLPGAKVTTEALARESPDWKHCETDSTGICFVNGLSPGTYRVKATAQGHVAQFKVTTIEADAGPWRVELRLAQGIELLGQLSGMDAYPDTRFRVFANIPGSSVENADVDRGGVFRFPVVPAGPLPLSVVDLGGGGYLSQRVVIPQGVVEHQVELTLPWPINIAGEVTQGGAPCTHCELQFSQQGGHEGPALRSASTMADGAYQILLPGSGPYAVTIEDLTSGQRQIFQRQASDGARLDFELAGASLGGKVLTVDGQPANGAAIRLAHRLVPGQANIDRSAVANSFGSFLLSGLAPGDYAVSATLDGQSASAEISLQAADKEHLELVLKAKPGLGLKVFNSANGLPIEQISVLLLKGGLVNTYPSLLRGEDGLHTLPVAEGSSYDLVVQARGFARVLLRRVGPQEGPVQVPLSPSYRSLMVEISPDLGQPCSFELLSSAGLATSLAWNLPPGPAPLHQLGATYTQLPNGAYTAILTLCDGQRQKLPITLAPGYPPLLRFTAVGPGGG